MNIHKLLLEAEKYANNRYALEQHEGSIQVAMIPKYTLINKYKLDFLNNYKTKNMKVEIKKLSDDAIIPTKGSEEAAGYDLYTVEDYPLRAGERHLFKTDISIKIPNGYYGRIAPRSGLALKNGILVLAGVIDSDYIGPLSVILLNSDNKELLVKKGDRIAQIIFEKCFNVDFQFCDQLTSTERGSGGFGSTDKKE